MVSLLRPTLLQQTLDATDESTHDADILRAVLADDSTAPVDRHMTTQREHRQRLIANLAHHRMTVVCPDCARHYTPETADILGTCECGLPTDLLEYEPS